MKKYLFVFSIAVALTLGAGCKKEEVHVVIVPGYGAPVKGNTGYEAYVKQVADFVSDPKNGVDAVVATGSYTVLKDTSEAQSIQEYFNTVTDKAALQKQGVKTFTEQCAIISWQNISYTKALLEKQGIHPTKITVFGDQARKDELLAYAMYQFNGGENLPNDPIELVKYAQDPKYIRINFVGYDFGTPKREVPKTVDEIVAIFTDKEKAKSELETRTQDWSKKFNYDVAKNLQEKGCFTPQ